MIRSIRTLAIATVLGFAGFASTASTATASDCCRWEKVVTYKTVHDTVWVSVPYQKEVIRYDHCGKAYCTYETCYRQVSKTVCRQVPCVNWVKVCH
jgi:hypothetical protein